MSKKRTRKHISIRNGDPLEVFTEWRRLVLERLYGTEYHARYIERAYWEEARQHDDPYGDTELDWVSPAQARDMLKETIVALALQERVSTTRESLKKRLNRAAETGTLQTRRGGGSRQFHLPSLRAFIDNIKQNGLDELD